jgi:hypothetical protein
MFDRLGCFPRGIYEFVDDEVSTGSEDLERAVVVVAEKKKKANCSIHQRWSGILRYRYHCSIATQQVDRLHK